MLRLGKAIAKEYPQLNTSLLYAGIIIHDLGKVIELTGPSSTEYTVVGNLVGHLVLVDEEITKACAELKINDADEDIVVLRHMVLSHHGLLEYGSPVRPRIMEAEILHQIDNIDASMQMMSSAVKMQSQGHIPSVSLDWIIAVFMYQKIFKTKHAAEASRHAFIVKEAFLKLSEK